MDKAIAVIPARGGSKRLPKKNIKPLLGVPMIGYTIQAALECGLFERVVVSTDCPEIAEVSQKLGAEVPFIREAGIADDITPVSAATLDALNRVDPEGSRYGYVCQLMANCPMRDAGDISASYEHFTQHGAGAQISVTRYGWLNPWWAMEMDEGQPLRPIFKEKLTARSQDLADLFCPTGAIWWAKSEVLRAEGTFHTDEKIGCEINWVNAVDIDDENDWAMAEFLMSRRLAGESS
ncbi:cytidylyltransferase domain-containing protein [Maridesulfovibrio sp.]|uniref:acylneuraminate cytidylyltransferase family protein n=1 Tax=Maridesulfovibrio sp. TaxID=2795000 RepID=UPI0039EF90B4